MTDAAGPAERKWSLAGRLILLTRGDITRFPADAIVNAANSSLSGGGGVDGAIHRVGGPAIMAELGRVRPRGGCPAGGAVATGAGRLPARWVIHAVGPRWRGGGRGEERLLRGAYGASLRLAADHGARTVAFPSISTGAYGYPTEKAAPVALRAVAEVLASGRTSVREAVFVLFDDETFEAYARTLEILRQERTK